MIKVENKKKCCGCTACANICPQQAIEMVEDFEGFLYPQINEKKCINCGLCDNVCPYINKSKEENEVLKTSTSGGFLTPLFEFVLKQDGYICGVILNNNFFAEHVIYGKEKINQLDKFRGSKYVQSNLNNIFKEIKKILEQRKLVCFCDSPCQVKGLKKYLMKEK